MDSPAASGRAPEEFRIGLGYSLDLPTASVRAPYEFRSLAGMCWRLGALSHYVAIWLCTSHLHVALWLPMGGKKRAVAAEVPDVVIPALPKRKARILALPAHKRFRLGWPLWATLIFERL